AGAREPRRFAAVPEEARRPGAIRRASAPHDREPLPQRRGRPPRRLAAHGAEMILAPPPPGPRLSRARVQACGEGLGWGSRRRSHASTLPRRLPTPLPTLPHKLALGRATSAARVGGGKY